MAPSVIRPVRRPPISLQPNYRPCCLFVCPVVLSSFCSAPQCSHCKHCTGRSENRRQPQITAGHIVLDGELGTQRNTVGSLFICALLYNFGLTLPFGGVITGVFYNVSACNAHKLWIIHVWWAAYSLHYYATITFPKIYYSQRLRVVASVRLTGWPVAWNWRRSVLSVGAGLLVV